MATQLSALSELVNLLGGTKTTSNAGDTSGLQSVLAQLQAQNNGGYQQLLQGIFQQAAGAIPGYQNAFSSAVGARGSARNSGMETALSRLLMQTTLAGQQQIAAQQNQNLQTQAQAAGSIAQATKGTTVKAGTNVGSAAKNLAIISALDKLKLGDKWDSITSMFESPTDMTGFQQPYVAPMYAGDVGGAQPFQSVLGNQSYNTPAFTDFSALPVEFVSSPDTGDTGNSGEYINLFEGQAPEETYIPTPEDLIDYGQYYADGGLVRNFADGGSVPQYAAGSRRTSAPEYTPTTPIKLAADNTVAAPKPIAPAPSPTNSELLGGVSLTDTLNERRDGNVNFNTNISAEDAARNVKMLGMVGDVSTLAGATGNPSIPGMGLFSGLANAKDDESALKTIGFAGLNLAAPGAGSALSIALNPSPQNITNAVSMLHPVTAISNLGFKAFDTSIGEQVWGGPQRVDSKTGEVTREAISGLFGGPVTTPSPVSGWNPMQVTDLGFIGDPGTNGDSGNGIGGYGSPGYGGSASGLDGGFQSSFGSGSLGGTGGGLSGGGYNSDSSGGRYGGDSSHGSLGYANGGPIRGRGNGISDTVKINASPGEYIVSKDVVDAIGVDFFEALQQALHTPASIQRAMR